MLNPEQPSVEAPDQAEKLLHLLHDIAYMARSVETILSDSIGTPNGWSETAAINIAQRIGWMADRGLTTMGHPMVCGGAEEWMLPPRFRA